MTPRFLLGQADEALILAVHRYHFLTALQVCRLLYAPGSLTHVQTRLKRLADERLLQRVELKAPRGRGSSPLVYTLDTRGRQFLAQLGIETPLRRPHELREYSYVFLDHTLAVNDVLVAAELLPRWAGNVELAELRHERDLKRTPVRVNLPERASVVADGWLDLRVTTSEGRYQECVHLELDRGTEEQRVWRQKVAALVAYSDGPYAEAFGTTALTIAVVAVQGATRREQLRKWTATELLALRREELGEIFFFSGESAVALTPLDFYGGAHWERPLRAGAVPLIEGLGDGG